MGFFWNWVLSIALVVFIVFTITFIVLYVQKPTTATTTPIKQFFKKKLTYKKATLDLFDAIIYTNLDSRPDRRYQIESELVRVGFPTNKTIRNPGVLASFGALGCSLAILNALETFAKNTNWQTCFFCEDDLLFPHSGVYVNEQLSKFMNLNLDWDVLLISSNTLQFESTNIDFLVKITNAQTTAGFAVNRRFLPQLIENVKEGIENLKRGYNSLYCIDMHWKLLQPKNNWFTFHPVLAYQRDGFSDIENKVVSYGDKKLLQVESKKFEYLICVKTCLPRLNSNPKQTKTLEALSRKHPIDYLTYYSIESQKEEVLYNAQTKIVTLKTKDDYLSLCHKVGSMFKFLCNFIQSNDSFVNLKGIVLTDEDIELNEDIFYEYLQNRSTKEYYGNCGNYEKDLNLSDHIIQKCKISKSLQNLVRSKYPLLESLPIAVPKCVFTSGGFTYLSTETLFRLSQLDSFFTPFPLPQNLKFHLSKDKSYFENLNVFDDTQIGLALQSIGIFPCCENVKEIAKW